MPRIGGRPPPFNLETRFGKGRRKLQTKYIGRFQPVKQINDVTYLLNFAAQFRISSSCYVSLLKPEVPGPLDEEWTDEAPPAPLEGEGTPVCAVYQVLDSQQCGGNLQYLIEWEGYGPEERSWVAAKPPAWL